MRVSPLSNGTTVGKEIHHLRPKCLCREVEVIPPPSGIREDKQPSAKWTVSVAGPTSLALPMLSFRRIQAGWPAARCAPGAGRAAGVLRYTGQDRLRHPVTSVTTPSLLELLC